MNEPILRALGAFEGACKCWNIGDEDEANASVEKTREALLAEIKAALPPPPSTPKQGEGE